MSQSEKDFDGESPEPLINILQDEQDPEGMHKDISDLILSSYLAKSDLGKYVLSKAVSEAFEPGDIYPCVIVNPADNSVTSAIATAEGKVVHTAERYSKKELDDFKMPAVAIRAFFDYAGYNFENNN